MPIRRVHIMGASGAGVTTLGRALADALGLPHHDTDDYYWQPTDPPYREKRDIPDRLRLMHELFLPRPSWVLSGSLELVGRPDQGIARLGGVLAHANRDPPCAIA